MEPADIKVKIAPNSKDSEMLVLGCMLTSINSLNIAADILEDSDFYYTEHKIVFQVLKDAYRQDKPADLHLVCEELKRLGKLAAVGGVAYVTSLAQYAGTSAHIEEYSNLVRNKSVLRRMVNAAQTVEKNALEDPSDVYGCLDEAQQLFFKISQSANPQAGLLLKDILSGAAAASKQPYLKELETRQEHYLTKGPQDDKVTGVATAFTDLDKMVNGLGNSNLIILAARPAMGKTAFAINVAENVCLKSNIPVGVFSLEMTAEQLLHRMICSLSEVESDKIKTGALNGQEYQRIVATVNRLEKHTMIIDDQPGLKITDLRARARRMKESYGIGLLVIDYLQLLSGSNSNRNLDSRQNEISEISRMLKNLARELDIPIICLSQLSRKVEDRAGHRPMMSDLRESGCLAGDTVIRDAKTGQAYTIKALAEREIQTPLTVHAINQDLTLGEHQMTKVFHSGKKVIYELKTRTGRSIKASANHPFLKLEGWTALEHLKPGDKVGLPRKLRFHESQSSMKDNELILLAHLLGDGCILPKQPYHYTSADDENIQVVNQAAFALFGIQPRIVKQKNWSHTYLPSPCRLTHGKLHPITAWYNQLGLERVRSYDKRLPQSLFECSNTQIRLFLRHLWATDGNISSSLSKGRKPSAAIYYGSSSRVLCEQTQHLLLRVGIQSTMRTVPSSRGHRNMYHVDIQGATNQKIFLSKIGCSGQRGHLIPTLLGQLGEIQENPNLDVIPKEVWSTVIKNAKDQLGLGWREVCQGLNTSYCGSSLFKSGVSRERMQKLNQLLHSKEIEHLASSDVYWDEILSITELGIEDVYDATVENVHNFLANDIIVHNSIEQDADIVMFLLRREYYDPLDKPGMAELIVAKNRHGSIGSVNLAFRKELAKFVNYTPIEFKDQYDMSAPHEDSFEPAYR